jgi:hypothetical protein
MSENFLRATRPKLENALSVPDFPVPDFLRFSYVAANSEQICRSKREAVKRVGTHRHNSVVKTGGGRPAFGGSVREVCYAVERVAKC